MDTELLLAQGDLGARQSDYLSIQAEENAANLKLQQLADSKQKKLERLGSKSQYANLQEGTHTVLPDGRIESNSNKVWNNLSAANIQDMLSDAANQSLTRGIDGKLYKLDGTEYKDPQGARRAYMYGTKDDDGSVKFGLARGDLPSSDYRYIPGLAAKEGYRTGKDGYGWESGPDGVDVNKNYMDMLLPHNVATALEGAIHGRKEALANRKYKDVLSPEALAYSGTSEYYNSPEGMLGDTSKSARVDDRNLDVYSKLDGAQNAWKPNTSVKNRPTSNVISGYNVRGGGQGDYATAANFAEVMTKKVNSLGGEGALSTPKKIQAAIIESGAGNMAPKEIADLSNTIYRETSKKGMDPTLLVASMMVETANFNSNVFKNNRNFGGVTWNENMKNIPGLSKGTARPASEGGYYVKFDNPEEAVKRQVQAWSKQRINKAETGVLNEAASLLGATVYGGVKGVGNFVDFIGEVAQRGTNAALGTKFSGGVFDDKAVEDFASNIGVRLGYDKKDDTETNLKAQTYYDEAFDGVELLSPSTWGNLADTDSASNILKGMYEQIKNPSSAAASLGELFATGGSAKLITGGGKALFNKFGTAAAKESSEKASKILSQIDAVKASPLPSIEKKAVIGKLKDQLTNVQKTGVILEKAAPAIAYGMSITNQQLEEYKANNGGVEASNERLLGMLVTNIAAFALPDIATTKIALGMNKTVSDNLRKATTSAIGRAAGQLTVAGIVEFPQELVEGIVEEVNTKWGTSLYDGKTVSDIVNDSTASVLGQAFGGTVGGVHMATPTAAKQLYKGVEFSKDGLDTKTLDAMFSNIKTDKGYETFKAQLDADKDLNLDIVNDVDLTMEALSSSKTKEEFLAKSTDRAINDVLTGTNTHKQLYDMLSNSSDESFTEARSTLYNALLNTQVERKTNIANIDKISKGLQDRLDSGKIKLSQADTYNPTSEFDIPAEFNDIKEAVSSIFADSESTLEGVRTLATEAASVGDLNNEAVTAILNSYLKAGLIKSTDIDSEQDTIAKLETLQDTLQYIKTLDASKYNQLKDVVTRSEKSAERTKVEGIAKRLATWVVGAGNAKSKRDALKEVTNRFSKLSDGNLAIIANSPSIMGQQLVEAFKGKDGYDIISAKEIESVLNKELAIRKAAKQSRSKVVGRDEQASKGISYNNILGDIVDTTVNKIGAAKKKGIELEEPITLDGETAETIKDATELVKKTYLKRLSQASLEALLTIKALPKADRLKHNTLAGYSRESDIKDLDDVIDNIIDKRFSSIRGNKKLSEIKSRTISSIVNAKEQLVTLTDFEIARDNLDMLLKEGDKVITKELYDILSNKLEVAKLSKKHIIKEEEKLRSKALNELYEAYLANPNTTQAHKEAFKNATDEVKGVMLEASSGTTNELKALVKDQIELGGNLENLSDKEVEKLVSAVIAEYYSTVEEQVSLYKKIC